jgi:hypothetical protein
MKCLEIFILIYLSRFHAVGGPLPVSEPKFRTPLADAFLEAAHYLGNHVLDINAGKMKFKIFFFLDKSRSRHQRR